LTVACFLFELSKLSPEYIKAGDVLDAIPIIREALEGEDLRLNAIEFIAPYEQSPWTIEEDQALYDSLGTNFK